MTKSQLVASRLKMWRHVSGATLTDISKQCHLSAGLLSTIETGKRSPTLDVVEKLAGVMGLTVDELVKDSLVPVREQTYRATMMQGIEMLHSAEGVFRAAFDVYRTTPTSKHVGDNS